MWQTLRYLKRIFFFLLCQLSREYPVNATIQYLIFMVKYSVMSSCIFCLYLQNLCFGHTKRSHKGKNERVYNCTFYLFPREYSKTIFDTLYDFLFVPSNRQEDKVRLTLYWVLKLLFDTPFLFFCCYCFGTLPKKGLRDNELERHQARQFYTAIYVVDIFLLFY